MSRHFIHNPELRRIAWGVETFVAHVSVISTSQLFVALFLAPREGTGSPVQEKACHGKATLSSPLCLPGGILMYGALVLFESEFVHVVAISFTALILTELLMVALTVRTWHWLMVVAEFLSLGCYVASLAFLNEYFGKLPWNCFWIIVFYF